jgi:hypothetical protein
MKNTGFTPFTPSFFSLMLEVKILPSNEGTIRHAQIPPKDTCRGYLMADLILQDLRDLFSENLVQVLSNEKKNMFGEEKSQLKKRGDNMFLSGSLAGSIGRSRKPRTARWSFH